MSRRPSSCEDRAPVKRFVMKKWCLLVLMALFACSGVVACSPEDSDPGPGSGVVQDPGGDAGSEDPGDSGGENTPGGEDQNPGDEVMNLKITVGGRTFSATLADNAAAKAFAGLLPMTVTMTEYNGNEKFYDLPQHLPTDSYRPGTIREGDLMLWGSNTLVLFYETFQSSYSYTRLGQIDDPSGLAETLGSGNIRVVFEL